MISPTLWPAPDSVALDRIIADDESLTLMVCTCQAMAACPSCGQLSRRAHSRYHRRLADLPWHGVTVRLRLQTRRFFCTNAACKQRIFTERLPALVKPYARRTLQLQEALHFIALALGGRAGARLAEELGVMAQRDTLLRLVRKQTRLPMQSPRVLGVDDWAFRRGHHYGTILIDLEKHQVVDLLPDRQPETFAAWLKQHPGVKIISRDRAQAYAEGARQGAPDAVQIADRWHLLKNLVDAFENLLLREHQTVREVIHPADSATPVSATPVSDPSEKRETKAALRTVVRLVQEKQQRRERRLARYEEVLRLYRQGHSMRDITCLTGISRKTVRRYVQAHEFPEITGRQPRPAKIDPFVDYLLGRWHSGCHNSVQLYHEILVRGYTGKHTQVRDYLHRWRKKGRTSSGDLLNAGSRNLTTPSIPSQPPSTRSVLWWLLRPDEQLKDEPRQLVARLCEISSTVRAARELALWFMRMVRERRVEEFGDWIDAVRDGPMPGLRSFAQKLLSDRAAVVAALSYEWSNGQTEGQVNRLKLLKRQMYGRAGFDLLRLRVLSTA